MRLLPFSLPFNLQQVKHPWPNKGSLSNIPGHWREPQICTGEDGWIGIQRGGTGRTAGVGPTTLVPPASSTHNSGHPSEATYLTLATQPLCAHTQAPSSPPSVPPWQQYPRPKWLWTWWKHPPSWWSWGVTLGPPAAARLQWSPSHKQQGHQCHLWWRGKVLVLKYCQR